MPKPLSDKKREKLFAVYQNNPHVRTVARLCKVHKNTVQKYKERDNWEKRLRKIRKEAQAKTDKQIVKQRVKSVDLLDGAVKVFAASLIGHSRIKCPSCGKPVEVPVPKLSPKFRDIDVLLRLEQMLKEAGETGTAEPKRIKFSIEPPDRKL